MIGTIIVPTEWGYTGHKRVQSYLATGQFDHCESMSVAGAVMYIQVRDSVYCICLYIPLMLSIYMLLLYIYY